MLLVGQAKAKGPAQSRWRERLDVFCERGILGAVVLIVLWGPLAFGGTPAFAFLVMQGLTILALGLWAVRLWAQQSLRLLWPPVCWAVFVFVLYALVRCRLVQIEYVARQELIQVIVYASLFFVILNNFHRRESATLIVLCLILLGMVLSWDAIFQFATKYPTTWGVPRLAVYRGSATYINGDHLAGFLGMMVPLALSYMLMSRFSPTMKVLFAYCALAMLAGIGSTLSRGGILAAGAALIVFCLALVFQRVYWLPALGILAAVVALGVVFCAEFGAVQRRFEQTFISGHLADARSNYWPAAVHIFEDHPLWGGGPGHFDSEFARYRPLQVQGRVGYAHNDYLNTLADWGITGLAIMAAACALLYYGAWKTWPALRQTDLESGAAQKSDRAAFLLGACLGLLALLFHSLVDFDMHIPADAVIAVTLMALIGAQSRFATERHWKDPRLSGKVLLTVLLAAAMAWLAAQGMRRGREAFWQHRVGDENASLNDRLAGLRNACEAEPANYENSYNLGEYYRLSSQEGNPGYQALARQALSCYAQSMASNPLDAFVPMRYGMCLDLIGETNRATAYFDLAEKLDPWNSKVAYYVGRHYVELGEYAKAKGWFVRSLNFCFNDLAFGSLRDLNERMADPYGLYKK
ncbi:MAG: O-antigen ligase family protein [Limisphaerales bacterium]